MELHQLLNLKVLFDTAKTLRNSGQDAVNFQAWWIAYLMLNIKVML